LKLNIRNSTFFPYSKKFNETLEKALSFLYSKIKNVNPVEIALFYFPYSKIKKSKFGNRTFFFSIQQNKKMH
jgi:hypothetical protein